MKIVIIGAPFNGDGTPLEVENPSQSIRESGLISKLEGNGHDIIDIGDIRIPSCTNTRDPSTGILNFDVWREVSQRLSQAMVNDWETDDFLIVLGGDCSILMGIFDAFKVVDFPVNLFFLDGHADFHTLETSSSGEPADMELSSLTGFLPKNIVCMTGSGPLLEEGNVVVYGINEFDSIRESKIEVIDRKSIFEHGTKSSFKKSIDSLQDSNLPIWLHFDVDVMSKMIMPAIHYPVENGLSYNEVLELLILMKETKKVIGISIACYHPNLDDDDLGIKTLISLLTEFFN